MNKALFFLVVLPSFCNAQIITTFAGNGIDGYAGDGGQATAAAISAPSGFVIDHSGNVYIGGYDDNTIRKISSSGIITTIAGNGTPGYSGDGGIATAATLDGPVKMSMDVSGNIYFADKWNNRVRMISTSGIITTIAGDGAGGYSTDGIAATASELYDPTGVAVDGSGNIYIADYSNNRVRKVSTSGIISTYAGTGVAGNLGDGGPASAAQLNGCHGVFADKLGNIFIADQLNNKIRKVDALGIITTYAGTGAAGFGGDGGQATSAIFNIPGGVFVDSSNNVYVADQLNNKIREISPSGVINTICGNGTAGFGGDGMQATSAMINLSNEVAVDNTGRLFVADNDNYRVRIVTPSCGNYITSEPINDTVVAGVNAKYSVTTTVSSPLYQWQEDPGTGFVNLSNVWPYSGVTTDTLTINNTATYLNRTHYRCVVSSGDFCTDTSAKAILIVQGNAGFEQLTRGHFNIYPNPATNTLNITSTIPINDVLVTDLLGQTVFMQNYNATEAQIDVAGLAAGLYFVRVNHTEIQKFVKQ